MNIVLELCYSDSGVTSGDFVQGDNNTFHYFT